MLGIPLPYSLSRTSLLATQMYRVVWLYAALHGFAGAGQTAEEYRWPSEWRLALGQIACVSLTLGPSGLPEDRAARLEAELSPRLVRLGSLASAPALAGKDILPHIGHVNQDEILPKARMNMGTGYGHSVAY